MVFQHTAYCLTAPRESIKSRFPVRFAQSETIEQQIQRLVARSVHPSMLMNYKFDSGTTICSPLLESGRISCILAVPERDRRLRNRVAEKKDEINRQQ